MSARAWLLLVVGLLSVPVCTFALSGPRSSIADHQILPVLWLFSLLACVAAPLLGNAPSRQKIGWAFLGLCAFLLSLLASWALLLAIRGIPTG